MAVDDRHFYDRIRYGTVIIPKSDLFVCNFKRLFVLSFEMNVNGYVLK